MPVFNCECDDGFYEAETLAELRLSVLERLGYAAQAANPPPGMANLIDNFLRRGQASLYRRYRSLETERFFEWTMVADERFYDIRANDDVCLKKLDPRKITWAGVEDLNGVWTPLQYGIPPTFYTGVVNTGIPCRYEIRQCIEVFPAPAEAYTLRIKGHFGLMRFTEDTDIATLDSDLVFLWALARAKNHYGQADAGDVAAEANQYLEDLVAASHGTRRYVPGSIEMPPETQPIFLGLE
jgi:hypothetical protein